ncbi:MAG: hypothetical protein R3C28_17850 [Pirellulaceae bacterium]
MRYEYDTYVEMRRELPAVGAEVITNNGRARILSQSILTQQLVVEMEDHRRVMINATDVLTVLESKGSRRREPKDRPDASNSADSAGRNRTNPRRRANRPPSSEDQT